DLSVFLLKNWNANSGNDQKRNGFSKNNSIFPSVTSDLGETQKPFPNSEALAIVHNITGILFTCPLISTETFTGLYLKNSRNTNLMYETNPLFFPSSNFLAINASNPYPPAFKKGLSFTSTVSIFITFN